jgi:hypothetical protein
MRIVQDGCGRFTLEGEHTVEYDGETNGYKLAIPWVRDNDISTYNDIGV